VRKFRQAFDLISEGCCASNSKVSTVTSISSSDMTLDRLLGSSRSVVLGDEDEEASGDGDSGNVVPTTPFFLLGSADCALRCRFLFVGIVGVVIVVL